MLYPHKTLNKFNILRTVRSWERLASFLLAGLLLAASFVCANSPFLVTAVLPGIPAIPTPIHALRLGNGERAVS